MSNRTSVSPRAGWVFYQRASGWDFRMYNGVASNAGFDLTGGTSTIGQWSHVVGVWDGSSAKLFVNGVDTSAPNGGGGGYVANGAGINMSIGANIETDSPFNGLVDETAFYATALSPAQIAAHFSAASNPTPGAYQSLVQSDGALLHLNNVPEPATAGLLSLGLAGLLRRRRRA